MMMLFHRLYRLMCINPDQYPQFLSVEDNCTVLGYSYRHVKYRPALEASRELYAQRTKTVGIDPDPSPRLQFSHESSLFRYRLLSTLRSFS
jgi:hypothetical protein